MVICFAHLHSAQNYSIFRQFDRQREMKTETMFYVGHDYLSPTITLLQCSWSCERTRKIILIAHPTVEIISFTPLMVEITDVLRKQAAQVSVANWLKLQEHVQIVSVYVHVGLLCPKTHTTRRANYRFFSNFKGKIHHFQCCHGNINLKKLIIV